MTAVLLAYLAVLAVIAFKSTRSVKEIADFFVAKKGASTRAVSGSLVASILGGSAIIGAVDAGPRLGGAAAWFMLTGALGLLALIPLSKRAYTLGKYSLPDLIENMYGKGPRAVAAIVIPLAWTGIIAAQIIAAAKLLQSFAPVSYESAAAIVAAVFILYTMAGGQHSILRTDFLQAVIIVVGLAVLAVFCLASTRSGIPAQNIAQIGEQAPAFPFNANFSPIDLLLLLLTYGTTFTAGPDIFSRLFCAKDARTAKKSISIAATVLVPVAIVIGYLAAFGVSIENPQGARITAIAQQVLPPPLIPLIAVMLLSVVLSSADTLLLSSSVIICSQFIARDESTIAPPKFLDRHPLFTARSITTVNGVVALFVALHFTDIISTLLLALAVYAGAFTVPVLWGLFGLRSKPGFVAAAIIAGGAIALVAKLLENTESLQALSLLAGGHLVDILTVAAFAVNGLLLAIGKTSTNQLKK